jgi:hypothetical protein
MGSPRPPPLSGPIKLPREQFDVSRRPGPYRAPGRVGARAVCRYSPTQAAEVRDDRNGIVRADLLCQVGVLGEERDLIAVCQPQLPFAFRAPED